MTNPSGSRVFQPGHGASPLRELLLIRGFRFTCAIAFSLQFVCVFTSARAATYHVEQRVPAADDKNDGSQERPWKSISRAAKAAIAGDVVIIGNGVYRESVKIANSGTADRPIRFTADDAANVIVTGADRITRWEADAATPGVFTTTWGYDFIGWNPTHTHPGDDEHLLIGRCEQVFVNGYPLRQVLLRSQMARGTFFVDLVGKKLFAWSADNRNLSKDGAIVEASTRSAIWESAGEYVETRGIRFRYAANMAQHGAAIFSGAHNRVEDCIFERTNGCGATFLGTDIAVSHCTFADNGQLGFGADRAHRLRMSDCRILRNNVKGFSRGWEAGGDKLVLCRAAVIEHCIFRENRGNGIWFDIGNEDCVVKNCLIDGNEDAGIFDEISYGLIATDNVIINNGLADTSGAWGAAGGICLSSSPNSVIERNLLVGNKEGLSFREQERSTPRIDAKPNSRGEKIWNHDERIDHNILAYNRDAQLRGWFDVEDERLWPAAMQEKKQSLSLEGLKLQISDNIYAVHSGQAMFVWGVAWKRNKAYASLDDVRHELGLEQRSASKAIAFKNVAERDFRIDAGSDSQIDGCYPKGSVPETMLSQPSAGAVK
ncbi:MAG TPA: right-handed parallel beta-helix repeat-containing protein [Tepidisphaeraceae bacterium]|jgi:hypothetical protein|nr:right-handed parallel beta-helix repeat-containing protein [Tepidisphaeraceae bacterium]